jgi:hypothetical protein
MLDRQAAGKDFLKYLISNPSERDKASAHPAYARELFQTKGDIKLPPEVQIFAVRNRRPDRDNINTILIPDQDNNPNPLKYWIAAWVPYTDQDVGPLGPLQNKPALDQ